MNSRDTQPPRPVTEPNAILDWLGEAIAADDPAASSHWRDCHAKFSYENGKLSGLTGFDGFTRRRGPGHQLIHDLMQGSYKRHAAGYDAWRSSFATARSMSRRIGGIFDLAHLRHAATLGLLDSYRAIRPPALVIGDGYGLMTALLVERKHDIQVVCINLAKTLLVDFLFFRAYHPDKPVALALTGDELLAALDGSATAIFVPAAKSNILATARFSLAINIASMQEMNPDTVNAYFEVMRQSDEILFYCCNREKKILPDGTVSAFADYPWHAEDRIILDGPCPWHQDTYAFRPPFRRPFDGPHRHRLAQLAGHSALRRDTTNNR